MINDFESYYLEQVAKETILTNKKPSYPIYIPSKGRAELCLTVDNLLSENIPVNIVVEPQDKDAYQKKYGTNKLVTILTLDENDRGISYARNFIKSHSKESGDLYHWCIDDNVKNFRIRKNNKNVITTAGWMLYIAEQLMTKYDGIGGISMVHIAFAFTKKRDIDYNKQIYSCMLLDSTNEIYFREDIIEDTDYSLQILSQNYCTILLNRFIIDKPTTMTMKGGNTDSEYVGDRRMTRAVGLQKMWPHANFQIYEKDNIVRIRPSRIWRTFKQRPISKDSTIIQLI